MDFTKYEFAGCKPTSLAQAYPVKEYSHSEIVKGKKVDFYNTYRVKSDFYNSDVFSDDLSKSKIRQLEKTLGIKYNKDEY